MTVLDYKGTYTDQHGSEALEFHNDSTTLTATIRGVVFSGNDFDSLEPTLEARPESVASFTLSSGHLCRCTFTLDIPIPVVLSNSVTTGILTAMLDLGAPATNGGIEHEQLLLALSWRDLRIVSSGGTGYFENELLDIQNQLPEGAYIQACINCRYSDYSPYGNGLFGNMLCFRNIKDEYLRVTSKEEFWAVYGREERQVQETYLCEQFMLRTPGTGYRG
jgi:hypothetical protein